MAVAGETEVACERGKVPDAGSDAVDSGAHPQPVPVLVDRRPGHRAERPGEVVRRAADLVRDVGEREPVTQPRGDQHANVVGEVSVRASGALASYAGRG